jgi:hypothetical protein
MTTPNINMARIVASQTAFAIECDGFLVGYNGAESHDLLIQNGPMVISARPAEVALIQDPPHLAIITDDLTAFVDITERLRDTLTGLYGGVCQ